MLSFWACEDGGAKKHIQQEMLIGLPKSPGWGLKCKTQHEAKQRESLTRAVSRVSPTNPTPVPAPALHPNPHTHPHPLSINCRTGAERSRGFWQHLPHPECIWACWRHSASWTPAEHPAAFGWNLQGSRQIQVSVSWARWARWVRWARWAL